jgi:hypothetical protein
MELGVLLSSFAKWICTRYKTSHLVLSLFFFKNFRQDKPKAVEILVGDLKVFSTFNEELYKEITQLLILNNFR